MHVINVIRMARINCHTIMIRSFFIFSLLLLSYILSAQTDTIVEQGTVSYVSSQNVYVKFRLTENININDTLFIKNGDQLIPALIVKYKSSTSCVCSPITKEKSKPGDIFYAKYIIVKKTEKELPESPSEVKVDSKDSTIIPAPLARVSTRDEKVEVALKQKIKGRVSAGSYTNFYGGETSTRMRYTFSFQGNNIKNSKFSTDNYITFRHTLGEWQEVKDHFSDALKVYALSVKYDFDKTSSISLGRKINYKISSMGAIDGVQYEKGFGGFQAGAIVGSRPNYKDYGLDLSLFQVGGYLSYSTHNKDRGQESTLAFVEQRNNSKTDRRFVYFQHINTLMKNLSLFSSFEFDLYQNINNEITNEPVLTNLLINLRYKLSKNWDVSLAYDNRKNIVYYESYKSYIEQLIENETRQGFRLGSNYRFSKLITAGLNLTWNFQSGGANYSKNLNSYVNFSTIPVIKASASISANILQTSYLDSKMYGIQMSKDIIKNKLSADIYSRLIEYDYKNYEGKINQTVAGINLSWNITRKLAFFIYYEGTFDKQNETYNSLNTKIVQRF